MRNIQVNIVANGDPKRVPEVQLAVGSDSKRAPVKVNSTGKGSLNVQIVTGRDPKRVIVLQ